MRTALPKRLVISLALALAAATIAVGVISFQRKLGTFETAGLALRDEAGVWVSSVDLTLHPNLRTGDRILLVGGDTARTAQDTLAALRHTASTEIVVMRGDEALTLPFVRAPLAIDWSYLVQAFIGAIYLLIGLFTILREQSGQSRIFYLWCLASSAFYILVSTPTELLTVDSTGRAIYVLEEVARLLVPALTLHFFLVFPRHLAQASRTRSLIPAIYLPSAFLLALQGDLIFNGGRALLGAPRGQALGALLQRLDRYELWLFVGFALLSAGLMLSRLLSEEKRDEKRRLLWIALGMAGGYVPFLLLYQIPFSLGLVGPPALEVVAVLPLALVPLTFAYAILRYRLWDISVIARDVATYTLTLLFGLLGFSVLQMLVDRGIPESQAMTRNVLSLAAVVLVGGLLAPARQGIGSTLERVQYRNSFGKRRTLRRLGRELLHDRDLETLGAKLLDHLQEAIGIENANLLLCEDESLVPLRPEISRVGPYGEGFAGADFWSDEHRRITGVALPDAVASTAQRLFVAGYRYAFPLTVQGRRVGVLVCGYRYGDIPLSSEDLELVRQLLDQAALAIENAMLLDRLHSQLKEVRQLKQYSEGIIEASPAGIAVLDGERIVSANLAFAALVGSDPGQLKRRHLLEVLPLERVPRPGDPPAPLQVAGHGHEVSVQVSAASFSRSETSSLTVLVVNDVTERVAMERQLEEKDRLAALGVMAAGIAHEVNTPITGISSYAQMLLEATEASDPRYPLLQKVERQTFRASRIVNSLLSLARNQEVSLAPLDLRALLAECVELTHEKAARYGVEISLAPAAGPLTVLGSEPQLQQVFTNLLQNGVDAMRECGGSLRIEAVDATPWIEVRIDDEGPGIPQEHRDRIFEPFFSTKVKAGGTGLGLSISHEIVRRHGGELMLWDRPGGTGCRFTVRLKPEAGEQ